MFNGARSGVEPLAGQSGPASPLTPLMRQYHALKGKNPEALLFFRLGDFYELFYDDAKKAAPLLEVVLTQRQGIPMCGVPHHALPAYLAKILKLGHRAAIAEQTEDPATAKGMVQREVVRVVSPGTVLEEELLSSKQNNFLLAVSAEMGKGSGKHTAGYGLAALDMSTGELLLTAIRNDPHGRRLADELARLEAREILIARHAPALPLPEGRAFTPVDDFTFDGPRGQQQLCRRFSVASLAGFGLENDHPALPAVAAVLAYIENNQPAALESLKAPRIYQAGDYLILDDRALRHLDLLPKPGTPSLLDIVDHTVTPMGGRKLKWWLLHPLRNLAMLKKRQDRVAVFLDCAAQRKSLRTVLADMADVERVLSRLAAGGATGRDLVALRRTLRRLPAVINIFSKHDALNDYPQTLEELLAPLAVPEPLGALLETSLAEEPPTRLSEGGVMRDGFHPPLDELRALAKKGRAWVSDLEASERLRTGIGSLKVGYTSVFGYYLEVTRANLSKVPPEWTRKQTLANAERFITPELKAQEYKIMGAEEKAKALEAELFVQVRAEALKHRGPLTAIADSLAELDALASLAQAAERGRYVRPLLTEGGALVLEKARHPVLDQTLALGGGTPFVPNDVRLDGRDNQILLVTGPNMGGKSTYLRQTALLCIMAQMGSFVPAEKAEVGLLDRVFTRIGAGDNLAGGASTFLVEMQEVSNILHNATEKSLVVLDEVGRGTSTYDGVAVAWSVVEYLHRAEGQPGCKVLFATHYFELTQLAERLPGVKNFHAAVREWARPDGHTELVFMHQILPGSADRSYGVHVAQMAGLPPRCLHRAREILDTLEKSQAAPAKSTGTQTRQMSFFGEHPVLQQIVKMDVDRLTPLEALAVLSTLAGQLKKEERR